MFSHSFARIDSIQHPGARALEARASRQQPLRRATPASNTALNAAARVQSNPSIWSQSAVAAELASLTRLFKRLMRSRSRSTATRRPVEVANQWQTTVAAVRHAAPADVQQRVASAAPRITGADRVPAILRKAQHVRRLSPVLVGGLVAPAAAHHPRVHADPVDPQRVMISGSFAEVCATLDRLVDSQETALAQG